MKNDIALFDKLASLSCFLIQFILLWKKINGTVRACSQDQVEAAKPAATRAVASAGDRRRLLQLGGRDGGGRRRRLQRGGGLLLGGITVPAGGGTRGRFGRRPPLALSHRALFQLKKNRLEWQNKTTRGKVRRASQLKNFTHFSSKHQHILAKS